MVPCCVFSWELWQCAGSCVKSQYKNVAIYLPDLFYLRFWQSINLYLNKYIYIEDQKEFKCVINNAKDVIAKLNEILC